MIISVRARNFEIEISDPLPPKGPPPILGASGRAYPMSNLESSKGMMTNEKVVRNFILNKSYYNIFPLAAIFGTPYIPPPDLGGVGLGDGM